MLNIGDHFDCCGTEINGSRIVLIRNELNLEQFYHNLIGSGDIVLILTLASNCIKISIHL